MGFLSYGYKDRVERLSSRLRDPFDWPLAHWFVPRWVVEWRGDAAWLHAHPSDADEGSAWVQRMQQLPAERPVQRVEWKPATLRDDYLRKAGRMLEAIQRGDIYEVNLCIAHEAMDGRFDPFAAFEQLMRATDAPFAGFLRMDHRFALCMSPERFLAFDGPSVLGEPMKGTRPRSSDPVDDARAAAALARDAKEHSENVMAVDVMRNDLSKVSVPGSVRVRELCGVRSYPRVHQLVSSIVAELRDGVVRGDAVRACFPMASMTGAPKVRAMQLIDEAEDRARGLYSGTMGFFAPDGSADLNVVIRTLLFEAATGRMSIPTGSALTAQCDAASEWEECLVKFNSIAHALADAR
jgi:para-aminobenzoate synthetase component 1